MGYVGGGVQQAGRGGNTGYNGMGCLSCLCPEAIVELRNVLRTNGVRDHTVELRRFDGYWVGEVEVRGRKYEGKRVEVPTEDVSDLCAGAAVLSAYAAMLTAERGDRSVLKPALAAQSQHNLERAVAQEQTIQPRDLFMGLLP